MATSPGSTGPGHADYTYEMKYGLRDHRGGGRSSARETAARVAAGALARKVVPGLIVRGALVSMGEKAIDRANWNWDFVGDAENPFFTPDPQSVPVFADYLDGIRKAGSSVGAVIEIVAEGVPAGPRRADLRQARPGHRRQPDVDQRRQGRRDRQRLRGGAHHRRSRTPTRCAWAMTASRSSCPTMPAAFWAASRPASRSSRASPSSRPRRS